MRFYWITFCVASYFSCFSQCGKVIHVHDGDTFELLLANDRKLKVRVAFIDAPEHGQEDGDNSKLFLQHLILGKRVCLKVQYKDPYGRSVALVQYGDKCSLNEEVLKSGWAWHYKQYSSDKHLASLENTARKLHLGLWQSSQPLPPWQWRKEHHIGRPSRSKDRRSN